MNAKSEEGPPQLGALRTSAGKSGSTARHGSDPPRRRKLKDWRAGSEKSAATTLRQQQSQEVHQESAASSSTTTTTPTPTLGSGSVLECSKAVVEVDDDGNKSVNEYLIIKTIGKGSFCKVKLCLNTLDNELYAMKICHRIILSKRRRGSGNALDHILREVEMLKRLQHPNIVSLKQVIDDPLSLHMYIIFEYLELGSVIRELDGTPLEEDLARSYFRDVLKGLDFLHTAGVVHCDIKPDNLLVSAEGRAKIIDFGSSKYLDTVTGLPVYEETFSDALEGTPAFMAPEMCSSAYSAEEAFKPPRDIWALGICLYCFVTGRLPFCADNVVDLYEQIKNEEPSFADLEADGELVSLLQGMLNKDPAQRLSIAQIYVRHLSR